MTRMDKTIRLRKCIRGRVNASIIIRPRRCKRRPSLLITKTPPMKPNNSLIARNKWIPQCPQPPSNQKKCTTRTAVPTCSSQASIRRITMTWSWFRAKTRLRNRNPTINASPTVTLSQKTKKVQSLECRWKTHSWLIEFLQMMKSNRVTLRN